MSRTIDHITPGKMIDAIRSRIDEGYGFVPLIGSGMSAASGIPAGTDYQAYLLYCLKKVFPDGPSARWNPRDDPWPAFSKAIPSSREALNSYRLDFARGVYGEHIDVNFNDASLPAAWAAGGATMDWRAILFLLSRVSVTGNVALLKGADNQVPDSLFAHLIRDRVPNTAHMLLAHLADVLRLNPILTTNFDELIEQAFFRLDMPLVAYHVHHGGGLPSAALVRGHRSLVKLHGGRYGLRADFSLDVAPNTEDCQTFLQYIEARPSSSPKRTNLRHIIVMGVSGREQRTVDLLKSALRAFEDIALYWLGHKDEDVEIVSKAFGADTTLKEDQLNRIRVAVCPDLGQFLLNLYQRLFLCVPPAGVPFRSTWPVPPPLAQPTERRPPLRARLAVERDRELEGGKLRELPATEAAELFMSLASEFHCIWLSATNAFDEIGGAIAFLEALARKIGTPEELPPPPTSRWDVRSRHGLTRRFNRLRDNAFADCIVFMEIVDEDASEAVSRFAEWLISQRIDVIVCPVPPADVEAAQRIRQWIDHARSKGGPVDDTWLTFALGLTLFHSPCYFSSLLSRGLIKTTEVANATHPSKIDADQERAKMIDTILKSLGDAQIVCHDEAHGAFVRRELREPLRDALLQELGDQANATLAAAHEGIADWYIKLFRACGDMEACLDSMAHRFACMDAAIAMRDDGHHFGVRRQYILSSIVESNHAVDLMHRHVLQSQRMGAAKEQFERVRRAGDRTTKALAELATTGTQETDDLGKIQALQKKLELAWTRHLMTTTGGVTHFDLGIEPRAGTEQRRRALQTQELWRVNRLTIERRYTEARDLARHIFSSLDKEGVFVDLINEAVPTNISADELRQRTRRWALAADPAAQAEAIELLRRMQLLQIYRFELAIRKGPPTADLRTSAARKYLTLARGFYIGATEIMRFVKDTDFLQRENALLRTNTGIVLSWCWQYAEAQRRYSEAYGYLNQLRGGSLPRRFATVDLRRAETFLCQLFDDIQQEATPFHESKQYARLYDAIRSIDRAAYKIRRTSVNARWFSWLHEADLALCWHVAMAKEPTRFANSRGFGSLGAWLRETLHRGLDMAGDDPVRLARYLQLTTDLARIARERPIPLKADEMNDLRQCIEDLRIGLESSATSSPARDREVDEYVAHVLQTC